MCRFTLYLGPPIRLSTLLFEPEHSLVHQSAHSYERAEPLNGDGFGVGWYAPELAREPALFRSITPAWNNRNLASLAPVVVAPCIMAHVRAATRNASVDEANCHPFRFRELLCMHNGDVGDFEAVRRPLLESVCDEAFGNVFGSTDSEHVFALVIDELLRAPRARGDEPLGAAHLAEALRRAVWRVVDLVAERAGGAPIYLNLALTDGRVAAISRFAWSGAPMSLYLWTGDVPAGEASRRVVVSSERLNHDPGWEEVPSDHLVLIDEDRTTAYLPCDRPDSRRLFRSA